MSQFWLMDIRLDLSNKFLESFKHSLFAAHTPTHRPRYRYNSMPWDIHSKAIVWYYAELSFASGVACREWRCSMFFYLFVLWRYQNTCIAFGPVGVFACVCVCVRGYARHPRNIFNLPQGRNNNDISIICILGECLHPSVTSSSTQAFSFALQNIKQTWFTKQYIQERKLS